jgi:DNA repair protein RadC
LIGDKKNEVLMAIFFNSNKEIIDSIILSEGTVTESVAFPRRIAEEALKNHSVSVVLVHNHPGGFCKPSENDLRTTREISHSLVLIGVSLLEHIIIADEDYFSFAQSGLI